VLSNFRIGLTVCYRLDTECCPKVNGLISREVHWEVLWSLADPEKVLGHGSAASRGIVGPQLIPLSLLLPGHEVSHTTRGQKAMGPYDHGL
jgi:hypothetical protein